MWVVVTAVCVCLASASQPHRSVPVSKAKSTYAIEKTGCVDPSVGAVLREISGREVAFNIFGEKSESDDVPVTYAVFFGLTENRSQYSVAGGLVHPTLSLSAIEPTCGGKKRRKSLSRAQRKIGKRDMYGWMALATGVSSQL